MSEFNSIEEIAEHVREAYRRQRQVPYGGTTPKLDLSAARPSPLIDRAIDLSGAAGISNADLRRALCPPIAKERFERAMHDLESAG